MTMVSDLIGWLLDSSPFDTRWHCIKRDSSVGWPLLAANGLTWATYWALSIPLIKIYRAHRSTVGAAWLLAGFAAFVALCGTHHLFYVVAFFWPSYRLMAINDGLMAGISTWVCVAAYLSADRICRMRPASEVDAEREAGDAALAEAALALRALDERNVAHVNAITDLRNRLSVYEAHYGRDRAHYEISEAIRALTGGPSDGEDDHGRGNR